jgi:branched-chain amino acid transport system ATP-binding protein
MNDAVLRVEGLSKSFGGVDAVRDVSFDVAAGELVALIGPNGAGKTTCFNSSTANSRPMRAPSRCRARVSIDCRRGRSPGWEWDARSRSPPPSRR